MSHNGSPLIAALRRRFRYDPKTGKLFYRVATRKFKAGDEAGTTTDAHGYMMVYVSELERTVPVHSVCFAMHNGYWPKLVDHRDGVVTNNRAGNLRETTRRQNALNAKVKGGSSKYRGVSWKRVAWSARIRNHYGAIDLGIYDREEDAALAYNRKAKELFGEYARLNPVTDDGRELPRRRKAEKGHANVA